MRHKSGAVNANEKYTLSFTINLLVDPIGISYQHKIRKAQDQIDDAIDQVETLSGRLGRY